MGPMSPTEYAVVRTMARGGLAERGADELAAWLASHDEVIIDVGTGDGSYPYRQARARPGTLCVGVDPAADSLKKNAGRIGRKPSRGGVDNLLLIVADLEHLPAFLEGTASELSVFYPWGTLMRAVAEPSPEGLRALRRLLKPGGRFTVLLNMQVFEDETYRQRSELPTLSPEDVDARLRPAWQAEGLSIEHLELLGPRQVPIRTTWGQRLTRGSGRNTLHLRAVAVEVPDE